MSNIPPSTRYIQNEETAFRASISEGTLRDIGATINYLLANATLAQVGDTKRAFLSEELFQAQMGEVWVLMDGRDVTGSAYHALTGNTNIPDGRGVFLKNKRNGSIFGTEYPLGYYEIDGLFNHTHLGTVTIVNGHRVFTSGAQNWGAGNNRYAGDGSLPISATITATIAPYSGLTENRPRSVCCNFFIKIN